MKAVITGLVVLTASSLAFAQSDPIVIESYDYEQEGINYTVTNPDPSTVGHIVAFVIEVNADLFPDYWPGTSGAASAWQCQRVTSDNWTGAMEQEGNFPYDIFPLTWQEFFGGIEYPFPEQSTVGYFARYSEVSEDTFGFDDPSDAILPGESRDGFHVTLAGPLSMYQIAYIEDADDTFTYDDGLPSIQGETGGGPPKVAFSVEREPYDYVGAPGSALDAAWGTGTLPNTIYNSAATGTNTVGLSGHDTGTSGTQGQEEGTRPGQDVDAVHFGPMIDPSAITTYYFSLDFGSGHEEIPYPEDSGTALASGTGTAPSNVYGSTASGTNHNAFPGPAIGIIPEEAGNVDALNGAGFVEPTSYPAYFSLDLFEETEIDFDEDGETDVTVNGADILRSTGGGTFEVFLSAEDLGLNDYDNLDALVGLDDESWLFSVDYGYGFHSGVPGTAVDDSSGSGRTPANIFRSFGDGTNTLWLSSEDLGLPAGNGELWWGVNLDALAVPEPSTLALLAMGAVALLVYGWRRKKM